jgi:hypothetical protein
MEHIAERPSWHCRVCGKPWPCDPARARMAAEMDRTQLAIYMWGNLEEATGHLPNMPAAEAFDRFLAWTQRPVPGWDCPSCGR